MNWSFSPITLLLLLSAGTSSVVGVVCWRRRTMSGSAPLMALATGVLLWSLADFLMLNTVDYRWHYLFNKLSWFGGTLTPLAMFSFALVYTGYERFHRRLVPFHVALYVVTVLLGILNPWNLVYVDDSPAVFDASGTLPTLDSVLGPYFYVFGGYAILLFLTATVVMVWEMFRIHPSYRKQYGVVALGQLLPTIAFAVWLLDLTPVEGLDPTPFAFGITGATYALTLFSFRLLDLRPVARHTLLEELEDGMLVVDADERVIDVNPAFEAVADGTGPPGVGDPVREVWPAYERFVDADADAGTFTVEADGTTRHFDVRVTAIEDDRGHLGGRIVLLRDVTERNEQEHELQRQNERLEEFASIVSHDLRNPLNVSQGYVDVIRETGNLAYLDDVEASNERMEKLVDDLLTLARRGRVVDDLEPTALADIARTAWNHVDQEASSLTVELDRTVLADESRLTELFENLFSNAVEHGGAAVDVRVGSIDGGFFVEDDGPGIPRSERDRVFDSGYTTAENGTGFGLNIVDQIVDAHGWSITVTDGTDGGARFEILVSGPAEVDDPPNAVEH